MWNYLLKNEIKNSYDPYRPVFSSIWQVPVGIGNGTKVEGLGTGFRQIQYRLVQYRIRTLINTLVGDEPCITYSPIYRVVLICDFQTITMVFSFFLVNLP